MTPRAVLATKSWAPCLWLCSLWFGCLAPWVLADDAFVDLRAELGIDFLHQDGRSGRYFFPETVGSGGGWIDVDGDGDLDLYLVNGAATPGSKLAAAPRNALYENRDGKFIDIAAAAGVDDTGYGVGFCAGDYDGDQQLDFMVTNVGADRLYRHLGKGAEGTVRFEDRAAAAGVAGDRWSASCAFADVDRDGDLDLYVTHYVDYSYSKPVECRDRARDILSYCHPDHFDGVSDALYINQGDGTFRQEGRRRGIAQGRSERGLGVVASDLDDDGDLDLYVTNDGTANRLYQNAGDGTFVDLSLLSGAALDANGAQQAGMGIAAGDINGDGLVDLAVTNFSLEPNNLFVNLGDGLFEDRSRGSGVSESSFKDLGWGIAFVDYDGDGDLDLATANGHIMDNIEKFVPDQTYAQGNRLLQNDGRGGFRDISSTLGAAWQVKEVSRGLAVGDYDNDGRPDLLITHSNAPVDVLHNRTPRVGRWLGLRLEGPPNNRFAIGARVQVTADGRRQVREVLSGGGVLTQGDLRPLFGLGRGVDQVTVDIRWPDGHRQRLTTDQLDRYWTIAYAKTAK